MACPFFMPEQRLVESPWAHPARLPLGDSWAGHCTAPGHEQDQLTSTELKHCNVGYAARYCPRLPAERSCDAVRFTVLPARNGEARGLIQVQCICEVKYEPGEVSLLTFDPARGQWTARHADARIQRMAECYVSGWLARRAPQPAQDYPR